MIKVKIGQASPKRGNYLRPDVRLQLRLRSRKLDDS